MRKLHRQVTLRKLKLLDDSVSRGNLTPALDQLFQKFPASFPPGYSLQDIRQFDGSTHEIDEEGMGERDMRRMRRMRANLEA